MIAPSRSLKELFLAALEVAPEDRAAWVERECAADLRLREQLSLMLAAHDAPQSLLDRPAAERHAHSLRPEDVASPTIDQPMSEGPGTVIGPYKLLQQIGEGGFGVVFMAEQTQPIRRKVALKVLKPGMDTHQIIARFEAERQALALMDHANIAKVLDAGQTSSGRPYFVMDLVKGLPITDYCDQSQLTPSERLELFFNVCQAVQHAHQKGIIHRDLKPSNVLVTLQDGAPLVKVIDFGIAKALGQQLTDKTLFTNFAQLIGTPLYMSPEQAALSNVDVDTRSDVYSLGVLLYELLTSTTPFDKELFRKAAYDEMRRIIREEEPPKPSTRISSLGQAATTVSTQRKSNPKRLSQLFRGELDWIVMKCLEKDRNRRYDTANALAADVQRYLHNEAVQACPPSTWYRFRKFARRYRAALAMASLVFLILLLTSLGLTVNNLMVRQEQGRTQAANERLQDNLELSLKTLDEIYLNVLEARLPRDAEMVQENEDLLNKGLEFYEKFAERNQANALVRRQVAYAYQRVSDLHTRLGHYENAWAALSRASDVASWLSADFPADPEVKRLLAELHGSRGQLLLQGKGQEAAAQEEYRQGIALLEPLIKDAALSDKYRRTLADLHHSLAWSLRESGDFVQPEIHCHKAIDLYRQLVAEAEQANDLLRRLYYMQALAMSHNDLGVLFRVQRRLDDAAEQFGEEIRLLTWLDAEATALPVYRRGRLPAFADFPAGEPAIRLLAAAHGNLGQVRRDQGRSRAAEKEYGQALALMSQAAKDWPRDVLCKQDMARVQQFLALILFEGGKRPEAFQHYRHAIDLLRQLDKESPATPDIQDHLSVALWQMGNLLWAEGDKAKATEHYREALDLRERLVARFPDRAGDVNYLAWFLLDCLEARLRDPDRAAALAQQVVDRFPRDAEALNTLGTAQYRQGHWKAAVSTLEKAKQLHQQHYQEHDYVAGDWLVLAMAHWQLGDKEAARTDYERAVKILSKYEYPPEEVGHWRAEAATLLGIKPDQEIKQEKLEADSNQPKEKPK